MVVVVCLAGLASRKACSGAVSKSKACASSTAALWASSREVSSRRMRLLVCAKEGATRTPALERRSVWVCASGELVRRSAL